MGEHDGESRIVADPTDIADVIGDALQQFLGFVHVSLSHSASYSILRIPYIIISARQYPRFAGSKCLIV